MVTDLSLGVSLVLWTAGMGAYLYGIAKKQIEFQFATWAIWTTMPIVTGAVQLLSGVHSAAVAFTLITGVWPGVVMVIGLAMRRGCWPQGADRWCFVVAALALVGWKLSGAGWLGVACLIAGDAFGARPTVASCWRTPGKESLPAYGLMALSGWASLGTVQHWHFAMFAEWGFAVYIIALYTTLTAILTYRRLAQFKRRAAAPEPQAA